MFPLFPQQLFPLACRNNYPVVAFVLSPMFLMNKETEVTIGKIQKHQHHEPGKVLTVLMMGASSQREIAVFKQCVGESKWNCAS